MALAKREAARRGLYSRFFRGPILGPDVQFETVETVTPAILQTIGDDASRVDTEKKSKKIYKIDLSEDTSINDSNKEKRQRKLRKKAEKTAGKFRHPKGKEKGDEKDAGDTTALSTPQEPVSEMLACETPHEMVYEIRKKKKRRRKPSSPGDLDISHSARTLIEDCEDSKGVDSSRASRKKRRQSESL